MPFSTNWGKLETKALILKNVPRDGVILDVGPGAGAYHALLSDRYPNIEAVEVFEPYIDKYRLRERYSAVYVSNIVDFAFRKRFDLMIMGDILEHLTVEDARKVIDNAKQWVDMIIVQVPFEYPQQGVYGNDHEEHVQDDLTHELFMERYPEFTLYARNYGNKLQDHAIYYWKR